jgi:ubiquinone/menaquinone biosynthesis C-methylase UbiE
VKAKELFPGVFSRLAAAYALRHAEIRAAGGEAARNRMLELVAVHPGERVLDIACGPGNLASVLVAGGADLVGIDLAEGMLQLARRDVPGGRFLVMDGELLEFADASFDAAVCGHGYQFMSDLGRAFAEARRVLRAGGRLGATLPQVASRSDDIADVAERWLAPLPVLSGHEQTRALVADPNGLRDALLRGGFERVEVERASEPIFWRDADHAVELAASFWDLASRIELTEPVRVEAFQREARDALRRRHGGGPIEHEAVGLVIYAVA